MLEDVAERLRRLRDRLGGGSVGILGSARVTVEEAVLLRRLAAAIGTPHIDTLQRIGYVHFPAIPFEVVENATAITVLGANLSVRQPQASRRVVRAFDRGARVRFVHSRAVQGATLGERHDVTLPGHELEALGEPVPDELVLVSSELALSGQGAEAARRLTGRRAMFLTDYVNQRGVVEAGLHPAAQGHSAYEMLEAAAAGTIKALLVFGDDPFEFFPALAARAFEAAELVVVVDAIKSPSARRADAVLPGALPAEKSGTLVNTEGRAQEILAVRPPPAGWTEGRLASFLIERLDPDAEMPPVPPVEAGPGGLEADAPGGGYPFLVALDTTSLWRTHAWIAATVTAWREARSLFADFPPGFATLNPDDARAMGIPYAAPVTITSEQGSITLPARPFHRMLPGTVWIPMSCWEEAGAALGALEFDHSLRIPAFRPRAVRVARAPSS